MRGRAGQGEGSSLPAHPGSDWDRNLTMLTFEPGTMAQVVMGRLYHGWVLLSIWAWGVIGPGAPLGEGRGRDGQGEGPILSLLQGKPTIGCRGRGGLWGSALVHPGGLTDRRLYCEANPRGRGRLWGSALVVPGGRSNEDYEESGNTGFDLLPERSRTCTALGMSIDDHFHPLTMAY